MSIKTLIAMFVTVAASFAAPTIVQVQEKPAMQTATPKPTKSGHAAVNGVNYYYAVYGTGEPLLLLHGGMYNIEMFGPNLARLAQSRQVIGVDLQGHGRTPLGDREINLGDIGNDMAGILKKLGYDKVDVLGYSMGGGVAFQFAAQHPEMVRRLVLVVRLVGGCQEADNAGDAHLRRQRHVPAGAHREVLPVARRWTKGCRLAARPHVAESPGDPARRHALRNGRRTADGRYRSAVP